MKRLIILSAIAVSGLISNQANAQIGFRISLNLGPRPQVIEQPPVYADDYYYLPDVEAYYSVSENCYYYNDGYNWVSAAYLPGAYRNYDWRNARRVEIREARPYLHNDVYRSRYGGVAYRDWNNRDNNRMYADRDHMDRDRPDNYRDRDQRPDYRMQEPQRDQHYYGNGREQGNGNYDNRNQQAPQNNYNRGQQQAQPVQPQQNNNNWGGTGSRGQQQAQPAQPQQNANPGNNNNSRGQHQGQPAQQQGGQNSGAGSHITDRSQFAQNRVTDPIGHPSRF